VYDSDTRLIYLFGGFTEEVVGDMWLYDPAANTWSEIRPSGTMPAGRATGIGWCTTRPATGCFCSAGWLGVQCRRDLGLRPGRQHVGRASPVGEHPSRRDSHAMVYDLGAGKVILFGGVEPDAWTRFGDTWSYGD